MNFGYLGIKKTEKVLDLKYVLPSEWSLDGNWQAGERQVFRMPIQCSEDKDKNGLELMIHAMENGGILPYWIKYTGLGSSWGAKDSDMIGRYLPAYL